MANWRAGAPDGPLSLLGIGVVVSVVVVDQVAKALAEATLPFAQAIDVLPFLALYRVHNTGIAFSMLAGSGVAVMTVLVLVVSAIVVAFWLRSHDGGRIAALGFALILGGALGNLVDRLRFGHVVDFLLLHIGERALFVFNLADAALTLGPVLLLTVYLWPAPVES
jgi:signal peptidase II